MRIILHDGLGASHLLRRASAPLAGLPEPADSHPANRRRATLSLSWARLQRPRMAARLCQPALHTLRRADGAGRKSRPTRRRLPTEHQARQACQTKQPNSLHRLHDETALSRLMPVDAIKLCARHLPSVPGILHPFQCVQLAQSAA